LLAGLINVGVISSFQNHILSFVILFVPLITGISGNVGLQCSTVLVRSMAIGVLSAAATRRETVIKELGSGLFTGAVFGVGSGVLIYMIDLFGGGALGHAHPLVATAVVGIGLFGGCIVGTLLGVFSPLFFARIGVDPAISAGPVVTALNDFLSLTIYFLIAWGISAAFMT
jgi:magnesium transporter